MPQQNKSGPKSPRHRDPEAQPKRSILRRSRSFERPMPRFGDDLVPLFENLRCEDEKGVKKRSAHKQPAKTMPAVMAELQEKYSEEQLNRVPPVFMPCVWGSAYLAEPYEVTLKHAAERGPVPIIHNEDPTTKNPGRVVFGMPEFEIA